MADNRKVQGNQQLLAEAAALGSLTAAQHLIQTGVDVNAQNAVNKWTPLHWAAYQGHLQVAQLLLNNGADPSIKNESGKTAVDLAKNASIKSLLLKFNDGSTAQSSQLAVVRDEVDNMTTFTSSEDGDRSGVHGDHDVDDAINPEDQFVPSYKKYPQMSQELQNIVSQSTQQIPSQSPMPLNQQSEAHQYYAQSNQSSPPLVGSYYAQDGTNKADQTIEVVVYSEQFDPNNVLGAIHIKPSVAVSHIKRTVEQELDNVPRNYQVLRVKTDPQLVLIPIGTGQMNKLVSAVMGNNDCSIVLKEQK
ncbi:hypothetical protein MP228_010954 [Amoeboaphelidium protococcarum]|nr:hypothetical protein MP228_010954 [Amoeboaphelidium protococcarum]